MPHDVNQTPEDVARDLIDDRLRAVGWHVQDRDPIDFSAGSGIVVREYPTDAGPADYVLFCDRQAVGVVEAKPDAWVPVSPSDQSRQERGGRCARPQLAAASRVPPAPP